MASAADHSKLLDQLQAEVNRVIEQVGRVFAAAASKDTKFNPVGQASKLKLILPESMHRFHDALDQLEDDLQLAKVVMRRDLAELQPRASIANDPTVELPTKPEMAGARSQPTQEESTKPGSDGDVAMDDSAPPATELADETVSGTTQDAAGEQPAATTATEEAPLSTAIDGSAMDASTVDQAALAESPAKVGDGNDNENNAPEGAMTSAAELEALFGPTPSTVGGGVNGGGEADFGANDADANVFDFTFDGEGDAGEDGNIESFLPGLSDYANTQPGNGPEGAPDADLDVLFSDFAAPAIPEQKDGEQAEGGRDTTFDELMDFADLGTAGFGTSGGGDGDDNEFDFNFS